MQAKAEDIEGLETITQRSDFLKIQSRGRKWVSHGLILQTLPNEAGSKRLGFTVSKKVSKSAVKRNRIKRRLRAAAADVLPGFAALGHDYVLVGRPETAIRPYTNLCEDLKWCLRKLGLEEAKP
jgi:ribonuclease P protein component